MTSDNQCSPDPTAEVGPYYSKFPYLSNLVQIGNQDFSSYNGLQITVNERPWHGAAFLAGYTYAHAFDVGSSTAVLLRLLPPDSSNVRSLYGDSDFDIRHRFTFSPVYNLPGMKSPGQMLQGWSVSGIILLQGAMPWYPADQSEDILGTGEINNSINAGTQMWNYSGPRSAFTAGPNPIPFFPGGATPAACLTAAMAPYPNGSQQQQLAVAALNNFGCYVQGGGILTPPAFGTNGNLGRNTLRAAPFYNVDLSVAKEWKFKERLTAQFRVEFFNLFNHADFAMAGEGSSRNDPGSGAGFGCACATPDVEGGNPVLGSGGPRHIQFGLKLIY